MHPFLIVFFSILAALLLLALLYLFSVAPARRRASAAPLMAHPYAHRGLHDARLPENSLGAFAAAAEAGYGIELDVRLSRDGVAMVFHDDTLARVCGAAGRVEDYTAKDLQKMPLCGQAEHTIPTFADVLRTVGGRVPLLVEVKGYIHIAAVCEKTAALLDSYGGAYMVESFSPFVLRWFRRHRPAVVRGQLSSRLFVKGKRNAGNWLVESLCCNFLTKPDFIAFCYADRRLLSFRLATRLFGAYSLAWTVKSAQAAKECTDFDNIIFEGYLPKESEDTACD